jgi:putative membrane protein
VALLGAATAVAQSSGSAGSGSGGAGSTSYGSSQKNPTDSTSSTTGTNANEAARRDRSGSTYGSSASGSASTTAGAATGRDTMSSKLSWGDRRFVSKAAEGGMDEVSLAQLAAQRASNSEVRTFAQKLVDDHSKVNSELMQIATQKSVNVDKDNDQSRAYKRLAKKSGAEFDQEFVEHMIDDHERDIKMFEKASTDAKDSEVRSFAAKHVDHLRQHLQTAQNLRQTVMPTGRMEDSSSRATSGSTDTSTGPSTTTPRSSSSAPSSTDTSTTPRRDGSR